MTSKGSHGANGTPGDDRAGRDGGDGDGQLSGSQLPAGEELELWLSAFLDGELSDQESAVLIAAMERDPALVDQLERLSARQSAIAPLSAAPHAGPIDVADDVLAAVAPAALHAAAGASRLTSQALDAELTAEGAAHLQGLLAAATAQDLRALEGFLATAEATQVAAEAAAAHPSLPALLRGMADEVVTVTTDDARAFELSCLAIDGELDDDGARQLSALLSSPARGSSRDRDHRQAGLAASWALSEALDAGLQHLVAAPEGARAGAAALQAISAEAALAAEAAERQGRQPAVGATGAAVQGSLHAGLPAPGLLAWLSERLRYLAPVAFAGAAAALFFFVGDPAAPDLEAGGRGTATDVRPSGDLEAFLRQVDQELGRELGEERVALGDDLPILEDNPSEVLSIDTSSQATLVFETPASGITVIWVSEASPDEVEPAGDLQDAPIQDHTEDAKGT